ncbi:GHKL domain-containing protein [Clostridium pasteurianum DSM 525 = ATCC 6013]|uniref:ATP-binding region ATPase domain protein n=1 Tax=Clostridium pasteurianum DSM 525 = ATCC 6013 TaxID=1262449 RepID=A0A0H3J3J8_CLOPA|nr:GHKL domain-containing protein [Clostridium pasteurianum]AJA47397.1 GHKL domain-containing protein [Clostridium pasteurianum DSM 525 = ATCC 6013]AJA51385.1 GHKL domain-containing protein [Clostridium pasteurianum DSM 525 = ATCC 6013]AOZ74724.1 ATP-binding protein [Clostridium pasteurianum DSM 525 = ATCC 6013]AOZ78520.1 ATP-binding protein [Clostridium pasteurianum]ELP58734.1 ATP-binding protein [Clostridium pasteurianum DSM 525 = ATCC 6013]
MQLYIKMIGTIFLVYVGMMNLNLYKFKTKQILLMIGITEVISSILVVHLGQFIALIPVLAIPMLILYKNNINIVKSTVLPIFSIIIVVISDYVLTSIIVYFFNTDMYAMSNDIKSYWSLYILELILVFITSKFLGSIINKKMKISNLKIKGKFSFLIIISSILTLIIMYANIILEDKLGFESDIIRINALMFSVYFIMLLVIMYILFTSIRKELELKNKQGLYNNLHEYTNNLEKLYTDMRKFKHDYANILSSMLGYMESNDMEGLKKHFNENIVPLGRKMEANNFKLGVLKNIKIPEIKGILSSKLIMAQELSIDTFIEITEPIDYINIDIINISRCLGILLDNAIEAAEKSDKPFIKLAIINTKTSVLIVISNSCAEIIPHIHRIYQKGFSTKGNNRGLGLNILKDITNKYENVYVDTAIQNGEFKQQLEIGKTMESAGVVNA